MSEAAENSITDGKSLYELVGRAGPPPLRIHHLMAVTGVAAVLLSFHEMLRQHDALGLSALFTTGWGVTYTVVTAISATVVLFGFRWRYEGFAFFDLPGHWLLVEQSLGVGLFVAVALSQIIYLAGGKDNSSVPVLVYFGLVNLVLIGIGIGAAWKIADSAFWRLLFLLHASQVLIVYGLAMFVSRAEFWIQSIPFVVLTVQIVAAVGDRLARRQRDWPHWLGVFLQISSCIAFYGQQIWDWSGIHLFSNSAG